MKQGQSFGPTRRIKRRREFLYIQGEGLKFRSRYFVASLIPVGCGEESRLGVTITTKIDKRAVRRNALRRRVRELFRKNSSSFPLSVNVVVIALNGACELDFADVERELCFLYRKAKRELPCAGR